MKILLRWYLTDTKKVILLLALITLFSSSLTVNNFLSFNDYLSGQPIQPNIFAFSKRVSVMSAPVKFALERSL